LVLEPCGHFGVDINYFALARKLATIPLSATGILVTVPKTQSHD